MSVYKQNIFRLLFFFLSAFLILLICSQNSFLYPFNTEPDVSCFYLVGRSIAHGKVLYRDIYEQKGLYLYIIYMMAYFISSHSYIGIYIIEGIFLTIYLYFAYKISELLTKKIFISEVIAIISALIFCTNDSFQEGGFAEEYLVSILLIIFYIALKYYYDIYPKMIPITFVITIGVLSAMVFWIKYTALGLVVGLGIYVLVDLLKRRKLSELFICFLEILTGFIIGSLPAVVYFVSNNAVNDLVQSYFVNLLVSYQDGVKYSSGVWNLIKFSFLGIDIKYLFSKCIFMVFLTFMLGLRLYVRRKPSGDRCIEYTFYGNLVLVAYGIIYVNCYQTLLLFMFIPISLVYIYDFLIRFESDRIKTNCIEFTKFFEKYFGHIMLVIVCIVCFGAWIDAFEFPAYYILGITSFYFLNKLITKIENRIIDKISVINLIAIKYGFIIFLCVIGRYMYSICIGLYWGNLNKQITMPNVFYCGVYLLLVYSVISDLANGRLEALLEYLKDMVKTSIGSIMKLKYVLVILCVMIASIAFGNNYPYSTWRLEDTPQYKIAEYIREYGPSDPVIMAYDKCDNGIYNLLGIDPKIKYTGYYNNCFEDFEIKRREYIEKGVVDYIVITSHTSEIPYDIANRYEAVLKVPEYEAIGAPDYLYLYKKK